MLFLILTSPCVFILFKISQKSTILDNRRGDGLTFNVGFMVEAGGIKSVSWWEPTLNKIKTEIFILQRSKLIGLSHRKVPTRTDTWLILFHLEDLPAQLMSGEVDVVKIPAAYFRRPWPTGPDDAAQGYFQNSLTLLLPK